jgi:hypothetical protein
MKYHEPCPQCGYEDNPFNQEDCIVCGHFYGSESDDFTPEQFQQEPIKEQQIYPSEATVKQDFTEPSQQSFSEETSIQPKLYPVPKLPTESKNLDEDYDYSNPPPKLNIPDDDEEDYDYSNPPPKLNIPDDDEDYDYSNPPPKLNIPDDDDDEDYDYSNPPPKLNIPDDDEEDDDYSVPPTRVNVPNQQEYANTANKIQVNNAPTKPLNSNPLINSTLSNAKTKIQITQTAVLVAKQPNAPTPEFILEDYNLIGHFDADTGPVDINLKGFAGFQEVTEQGEVYFYISRQHAEIEKQGEQWIVQDLGSVNGVFIKRQGQKRFSPRITSPEVLNSGDEVKFANIAFVFQLRDS